MENHIYRISLSDSHDLEFYICGTNEIEPYRETREIGIYVLKGEMQLDAGLNESEIESLIKYLEDARRYINNFNRESKTTPEQP